MHFQRLISSTAWSLTSLLCAITVCWGQYLTSSSSVFLPPGQRWESPGRVKQMWAAALQLQRCPCVRHSQLTWMDLPVCFSSITWREGKRGGKGCEWQYCWQPWPYSPVRGVGYFKRDTNIEVGKPHHCSVDEPAEGSCQCCRQGRANTAGAWSIGGGQCTALVCWGLLTVTGNYSTFFQS